MKNPASPASLSRSGYRNLALLLGSVAAIGPFAIDTYLPSFADIRAELGVSQLAVQQTLTAYLLPFGFMMLWHGSISDAIGRRRVVLVGLAIFALASIACATARSIEALWLFRAIQGITAGAGMVVGRAIIRDLFTGEDAQRLMAYVTIVFAVAPAVAPVIGGQLLVWLGWRSVFGFVALFTAGLWLWCFFRLPETLAPGDRHPLHPAYLLRSYRRVLTSARFLAVSSAISLNFCGFFIYVASAPVFLLEHLKVKETEFLWLFGPATAGMMSGSWLVSRVAGSLNHRRSILLGYGLMGVAALLNVAANLGAAARVPWAVAPIFLYTFGMTVTMPSLTLLALDLFPAQRGMASSCQGFIQTAINSGATAVIAPIVSVTTLRLASSQLTFLGLGLVAALSYFMLGTSGAYADIAAGGTASNN